MGLWHLREEKTNCAYCGYSRVCRRYDSMILAKTRGIRQEYDVALKALNKVLTSHLKPTLTQRYGGDD